MTQNTPSSASLKTLWLVSAYIVLASFGPPICVAAPKPRAQGTVIEWPLGRSGKERVTLRVPGGYFSPENRLGMAIDSARAVNNGPDIEYFSMTALWPGMITETNGNRQEFQVAGGGRVMRMLMRSAAVEDWQGRHFDALQNTFDVALKASTQRMCVGIMAASHCYKRTASDVKSSKFGLQRQGVDFAKYPDFPIEERSGLPERDIYYARGPSGELLTVIWCMAEEAKTVDDGPQYRKVAQCEQYLENHQLNALVQVDYRRAYLSQWRDIESAWNALLESSIVATASGPAK